jgi:glycosyltransferase involved in cell wall biosynthesis
MRIAFITDVIFPFTTGGSEIRNHEIAKRLVKKGHEIHIYGAKLWEGKDKIKIDGVNIHGISRYDGLLGRKSSIFDPITLSIKIFFKLIKEKKFDIIDTLHFTYFNCYTTKIISLIKKTPLVITWQQHFGDYLLNFLGKFYGSIAKFLEKTTISFTKFNVASSEVVKKDLMKEGMEKKNIEVIYNGVDLKLAKKSKALKEKFDLIFVGRLAYQKNPEMLIETMKILVKDFPKIKLCILGGGYKLKELLYLTNNYKLDENIKFVGEIRDKEKIFQYLKSSKIFVLPSFFEGFPLTGVEANACSLPIITLKYRLNRTTKFIYGNGLIAKPNPEDSAKKIKYLLKNKKVREKMGKKGIDIVKNFDWNKITDETESYYKSIIKKTK